MMRARRGLEPAAARVRCAFVGDSENDAACFAAFVTIVGVANVAPWVARLSLPPRYVTSGAMGEGFAELARTILAARTLVA
jgi:hydroxymethylpyrimidine pyrophosphatase-like HAD family hydrolase